MKINQIDVQKIILVSAVASAVIGATLLTLFMLKNQNLGKKS